MNEFKIYILVSILLLLSILIYEAYKPVGTEYSNAFQITTIKDSQYNIPKLDNSSLFVITPNNSKIIFYKNFYNLFLSLFISSTKSVELTPKNNTAYSMLLGNQTCYTPLADGNITFYFNPLNHTLTTFCFNQSVKNYAIKSFYVALHSVSSSGNSQIIIAYNEVPSISKVTFVYNNSINFYKPFKISCKSLSGKSYIYLFDNYGNKTVSSNGTATLNIWAYPNLTVTCYDGEEMMTKNINFTKITPILDLVYKNNEVYCNSTVDSEIYLKIGNEQIIGTGSVSYNGSNIHGLITCIQPGNPYQEEESKSINIA